jgi:SAM-dependent methyltransferase
MGDRNQLRYVRERADRFAPPYLEVGSRDHGSTQDLRALFAARGRYVGADLQDGPGVDLVLDLSGDLAALDRSFGGLRFGTIFCLSVLEHCARPFEMAENLCRLLAPGGAVCVGVPFAWKFHGYPSDYWRFTHEGVKQLFPRLYFGDDDTRVAGEREGDLLRVDAELGRIPISFGHWRRRGHFLRALSAGGLRELARLGPLRWLAGHRYLLAPTHLLMLGVASRDASTQPFGDEADTRAGAPSAPAAGPSG